MALDYSSKTGVDCQGKNAQIPGKIRSFLFMCITALGSGHTLSMEKKERAMPRSTYYYLLLGLLLLTVCLAILVPLFKKDPPPKNSVFVCMPAAEAEEVYA
jgi:predicted permease